MWNFKGLKSKFNLIQHISVIKNNIWIFQLSKQKELKHSCSSYSTNKPTHIFQKRNLMIDRRCISYNENDPANLIGGRFKLWKHFAKENENKHQHRSPTFRSKCAKTNSYRSSHPNDSGTKTNAFDITRLTMIISTLLCHSSMLLWSNFINLKLQSHFHLLLILFWYYECKAYNSMFDIELVTLDMTHTPRDY